MPEAIRSRWRNCAQTADTEILAIDRIEDGLSPLPPGAVRARELISALEMCHHKSERWVQNIIQAIGSGHTTKGIGTRSPGRPHPAEQVWQNACAALSAWCAGSPAKSIDLPGDMARSPRLLALLGPRTPLKEWQVHRVTDQDSQLRRLATLDRRPVVTIRWDSGVRERVRVFLARRVPRLLQRAFGLLACNGPDEDPRQRER